MIWISTKIECFVASETSHLSKDVVKNLPTVSWVYRQNSYKLQKREKNTDHEQRHLSKSSAVKKTINYTNQIFRHSERTPKQCTACSPFASPTANDDVLSMPMTTETTNTNAATTTITTTHHHHLVARSKSIADSTMRRQEGRSIAHHNTECSPRLSGLRSLSIIRSQD